MASIAPPSFHSPSTRADQNHHLRSFTGPHFTSRSTRSPSSFGHSHSLSTSISRVSSPAPCRCTFPDNGVSNSDNSSASSPWRLDAAIHEVARKFDEFVNSYMNRSKSGGSGDAEIVRKRGAHDDEWDWERWRKHFSEVDEQERIVSVLKSQLAHAITKEVYEDAARLKVAIAAAATNDTVGRLMSNFNKAVTEERYGDAASIRDYGGAGLVGWWVGISEDSTDPFGRIICIRAEHGRFVARSYSPRQLATSTDGVPLFEVFLTVSRKGEYRQQAVYLKRSRTPRNYPISSSGLTGVGSNLGSLDPTENKNDLFEESIEDVQDSEDGDDDPGFENVLRDMIPGVKVKVLKVTAPEKMNKDLISKVIEQIMEEEDVEKDFKLDDLDTEDESKSESEEEKDEIELDSSSGISDGEEQSEVAVKVVVSGILPNMSSVPHHKELLRVPARLEKKDRFSSFSFTIEEDENTSGVNEQSLSNKKAKLQGQLSIDHVMLDLAKFIGKGKIPMKVLEDVGELINVTLNQARNRQFLSKSTTFSRIEISTSRDPLNGLYIGAHGLYTSEVIHLRRRFGQWKEENKKKAPPNIEFYEYVEAVKLTGDRYVPAGKIAFRAKVGKQYQLPHRGIIPEEFGVIARYKGQGRLAEPGFRNPRWVDGELVILDGKYIKSGPVVGFVYWAPEYHFLVFFHRLRLPD